MHILKVLLWYVQSIVSLGGVSFIVLAKRRQYNHLSRYLQLLWRLMGETLSVI